ncbi:PLD nuclease N-terminal domain-containing protein [Salidesulfovibrio onnuriiensis]|uniref:PLD nuclease N-terminal domain-containing protein n=1 Tax=Salidesulfovibrio onnuriiensis TaxID=2583823 RepID=UPI0011CAF835|nr:PLD nuclease N-terminal domain-containing protein [Salidesulfovibrio onnuriiensis]
MFEKLAAVSPAQWGVVALLGLVYLAMNAWCILDAWKRDFGSSGEKVAWIQLMVFVPLLGALAYFMIGKNRGEITQ